MADEKKDSDRVENLSKPGEESEDGLIGFFVNSAKQPEKSDDKGREKAEGFRVEPGEVEATKKAGRSSLDKKEGQQPDEPDSTMHHIITDG